MREDDEMPSLSLSAESMESLAALAGLDRVEDYDIPRDTPPRVPAVVHATVQQARVDIEADIAERAVLGAMMGDHSQWAAVSVLISAYDFADCRHREIYEGIRRLRESGDEMCDCVGVTVHLLQRQRLEAAGGAAYLSELQRTAGAPANAPSYAKAVQKASQRRQLARAAEDLQTDAARKDLDNVEVLEAYTQRIRDIKADIEGTTQARAPIVLRHVADIVAERREPEWLPGLLDVLEANVLGVICSPRSTFKSFIALHWAMTAAVNGAPVVILSAEGAGLDRRIDAWMRTRAKDVDLRSLSIMALERAVNLNADEVMAQVVAAIEAAGVNPALIVADTYSKYAPGLDENDNADVALFLARLSRELRERFKCTVLLVAHSGHMDAKRPRGAYVLMANPDAEYIVTRPTATGMSVTVSRERFKDSPSLDPLAYELQVVDLGRIDRYGRAVTSLVPVESDALPAPEVKPEMKGKAQRQLLAAIRERAKADTLRVWSLDELRTIGREAGMHKSTARDAADALVATPYFVATIGGWRFTDG